MVEGEGLGLSLPSIKLCVLHLASRSSILFGDGQQLYVIILCFMLVITKK
jgi:hypothetical protein